MHDADAAYVSCPQIRPSRNDFDPLVNLRVNVPQKDSNGILSLCHPR